jgi:Cellulose binding domain
MRTMHVPRSKLSWLPRRGRRAWLSALVSASAVAVIALSTLPASALTVNDTPVPVTGNTTYFDGLGQPYGGCGMPQTELETQDFIALNVYNTPSDYNFYPRPLPASQADKIGMWNNGHNCGRWVQVTVSDFCTGTNDGAPNQAFCRNGSYVADSFNGATLNMLVADSCGDSNAWCRDDPYHIDLAKPSLSRFTLNGAPAGSMLPSNFNNRHMTWKFIPAPSYSGDVQIGFLSGAQVWWPAISVSHLANGIHGVEFMANGVWQQAQMNGDMGQSFILGGTTSGANQFQIRLRDSTDALINNGRVYNFSLPASCGSSCPNPYTRITYTTSSGTGPSTGPTTAPPTVTPTTSASASRSATPTPTSTGSSGGRTCSASYAVTGQWSGQFQADVTVRNTSTTPLTSWRVTWTFANGQMVSQLWSATLGSAGPSVVVTNATWNGNLAANATTTFGFLATWNATNAVPTVACTAT